MSSVAVIPQPSIRVDVEFYDTAEATKLLGYPNAKAINAVLGTLEIPTSEFLTYFLFHRKRVGTPGYRSYRAIGARIAQALAILEGCVEFDGVTIVSPDGLERQLVEISEHVGEAIGLSVVSRIHGLIEADWAPILTEAGRGALPSFDFQIASDGYSFVQAENKGSFVADNRHHDTRVTNHYRGILHKKDRLTGLPAGRDRNPAAVRYGTITAVDSRRNGAVKCWLTDPPADSQDELPSEFRFRQRLRFLRDWISFISPRSQLASALSTRIAAVEALQNPFELHGVPLRRGNGEHFELRPRGFLDGHTAFFAHKSVVTDGPAGGEVVRVGPRELFLLGLREGLLDIATSQDAEQILSFSYEIGTAQKTVRCVMSKSRAEELALPVELLERADKTERHVRIELSGQLHYSPSGLVFGVLPY